MNAALLFTFAWWVGVSLAGVLVARARRPPAVEKVDAPFSPAVSRMVWIVGGLRVGLILLLLPLAAVGLHVALGAWYGWRFPGQIVFHGGLSLSLFLSLAPVVLAVYGVVDAFARWRFRGAYDDMQQEIATRAGYDVAQMYPPWLRRSVWALLLAPLLGALDHHARFGEGGLAVSPLWSPGETARPWSSLREVAVVPWRDRFALSTRLTFRDGYVWEQPLSDPALFENPQALFDAARLASARSSVRIRLVGPDAPPPSATP